MSEARTIWHDLETRRSVAVSRQRSALLLGAALLIAMCAGEVVFLNYVAGPDTVNILSAAEGMPIAPE
jgi:ABC-type Fe3+-siderophore transport system permease subunit